MISLIIQNVSHIMITAGVIFAAKRINDIANTPQPATTERKRPKREEDTRIYSDTQKEYDEKMGNAWKTKTQPIESFSGKRINLPKWRRTTKSRLSSTGYKSILELRKAADDNDIRNSQLYSILEHATNDSSLSYLTKWVPPARFGGATCHLGEEERNVVE